MRDLVDRSGLPKTAIHHYLREGLLPPPEKPARNSAIYSERHLERLEIIKNLRGGPHGMFPISSIRRIVELIEQGVEPDVAVALHRSVMGAVDDDGPESLTSKELAELSGLDEPRIREACRLGIIMPSPDESGPEFDGLDLKIARLLARVLEQPEVTLERVAPIAEMIRAISAHEMELRNMVSGSMDPDSAARISTFFQEAANLLHSYLFFRARQHDIARHGLGVSEWEPGQSREESSNGK